MDFIKLKHEGDIAIIKFFRPDKLNSFTDVMLEEFKQALDKLEKNDNVRVVLISGDGDKAFSSGVDLEFLANLKNQQENREFALLLESTSMRVFNFRKPTIAVINGYALGGGFGMAAASDIRIASNNAKIGFPAVKLGAIMPITCTSFVASLIGFANTKRLMLTGEILNAEEAKKVGLTDYVVPHENLMHKAFEIANQILEGGDFALQMTKKTINILLSKDLEVLQLYAADNFAYLSQTDDWKNRLIEFMKKNKPKN